MGSRHSCASQAAHLRSCELSLTAEPRSDGKDHSLVGRGLPMTFSQATGDKVLHVGQYLFNGIGAESCERIGPIAVFLRVCI
jgi:hypothetical protein